jgi:hypothetical protein
MEPTTALKADGNLSKTPFAHLILYLYQHRSTGTLLIGEADSPSVDHSSAVRVLFQRGRAIAARLPRTIESLESGLMPFCNLRSAPYEFYEEDLVGSGSSVFTGMFDPHAFVSEAAHRYPRNDVVDDVLSRFAGTKLRIQLGLDVDRLRLKPAEVKLVEVLRAGPSDIDTLCSQSELSVEDSRRLLYVLIVAKLIVPYEQKDPKTVPVTVRARTPEPTTSSRPPAEPPSSTSKSTSTLPAVGVGSKPPAPASSIKPPVATPPKRQDSQPIGAASWQQIANRAGQASMRPGSSSKSTGSFNVVRPVSLTPPKSMAPPPETLDTPGKIKRIDQLFQRFGYDEAIPLIRSLIVESPQDAKYHGMLGFALLQRTVDGIPKEVVDVINTALRIDEDEPRALYTKALSYKRMGKDREALHYFKRTVSVDPGHIEAAREVRLLALRTEEKKKDEKKKGDKK